MLAQQFVISLLFLPISFSSFHYSILHSNPTAPNTALLRVCGMAWKIRFANRRVWIERTFNVERTIAGRFRTILQSCRQNVKRRDVSEEAGARLFFCSLNVMRNKTQRHFCARGSPIKSQLSKERFVYLQLIISEINFCNTRYPSKTL